MISELLFNLIYISVAPKNTGCFSKHNYKITFKNILNSFRASRRMKINIIRRVKVILIKGNLFYSINSFERIKLNFLYFIIEFEIILIRFKKLLSTSD